MKKILLSIITTVVLAFNCHANANETTVRITKPLMEISPEIKLQFSASVDEARKYISANPKATFTEFSQNFLNTKGFASKEAEALFVKVYEFAKLSPKALSNWDYKEVIVLATQIQSNLGDINAKTVLDITSLISTGPYNPSVTTSKWPWKQIILAIIDIIKDLLTNPNPN